MTRRRWNREPVVLVLLPLEGRTRAIVDAGTYEDSGRLLSNLAHRDLPAEVEQALAELLRALAESHRA
jgi:hypothetical protein